MYKIIFSKKGGQESVHLKVDKWESLSEYKRFKREIKELKNLYINDVLLTVFDVNNKQVKKLMKIVGFKFLINKWIVKDGDNMILSYYQLVNRSEEVDASNIR